jgi:chromate reductase
MATSPGARGAASVMEHAKNVFPHVGANLVATYSLPNFYQNFEAEKGMTNSTELDKLKMIVSEIKG